MRDEDWRTLTVAEVAALPPEAERERLKALTRLRQRERRRSMARIDYYPGRDALRVILRELDRAGASATYAGTLDRIIEEWGQRFRN